MLVESKSCSDMFIEFVNNEKVIEKLVYELNSVYEDTTAYISIINSEDYTLSRFHNFGFFDIKKSNQFITTKELETKLLNSLVEFNKLVLNDNLIVISNFKTSSLNLSDELFLEYCQSSRVLVEFEYRLVYWLNNFDTKYVLNNLNQINNSFIKESLNPEINETNSYLCSTPETLEKLYNLLLESKDPELNLIFLKNSNINYLLRKENDKYNVILEKTFAMLCDNDCYESFFYETDVFHDYDITITNCIDSVDNLSNGFNSVFYDFKEASKYNKDIIGLEYDEFDIQEYILYDIDNLYTDEFGFNYLKTTLKKFEDVRDSITFDLDVINKKIKCLKNALDTFQIKD